MQKNEKLDKLTSMMIKRIFDATTSKTINSIPSVPNDDRVKPDELKIYLSLMQRQKQYSEMCNALLDENLSASYCLNENEEYLRHLAISYELNGQWKEAQQLYKQLLTEHRVDDFYYLTQFIKCSLSQPSNADSTSTISPTPNSPIANAAANPPSSIVQSMPEATSIINIRDFLVSLQNSNPLKRGVFLAEIYLYSHLMNTFTTANSNVTADQIGDWTNSMCRLLLSYFEFFSSNVCFFFDVRPFITQLDSERQIRLVRQITEWSDTNIQKTLAEQSSRNSLSGNALYNRNHKTPVLNNDNALLTQKPPQSAQLVQQLVSLYQLQLLSNSMFGQTTADLVSFAHSLITHYRSINSLNNWTASGHIDPAAATAADDLLVIFVHVQMHLYCVSKQKSFLIEALLVMIEALTQYNSQNAQLQLLMIRLYCHEEFGGAAAALPYYELSLRIRGIVTETLSHVILSDLQRYGCKTEANDLRESLLNLHRDHQRTCGDNLQRAYYSSLYMQAVEFSQFNQRMNYSLSKAECIIDGSLTRLFSLGLEIDKVYERVKQFIKTANEEDAFKNLTLADTPVNPNITIEQLTSQSFNSQMLINNSDYSVVHCFAPSSSPMHSYFNTPASSLLPSDSKIVMSTPPLRIDAPNDPVRHATFQSNSANFHSFELKRLLPSLLYAALIHDPVTLRSLTLKFKNILKQLNLCDWDDKSIADSQKFVVSAEALSSLDNFDVLHWSCFLLLLDTTACLDECQPAINGYLRSLGQATTIEEVRSQSAFHAMRFNNLIRQIRIIAEMIEQITKKVCNGLLCGAVEQILDEENLLPPQPSEDLLPGHVIRHASLLAQILMPWTIVCVQLWATVLPTAKSFKKLMSKQSSNFAETHKSQAEDALTSIVSARSALGNIILTLKTQQSRMQKHLKSFDSKPSPSIKLFQSSTSYFNFNQSQNESNVEQLFKTIHESQKLSLRQIASLLQSLQSPIASFKF